MSASKQIDIENLIFARAVLLGVQINGIRGKMSAVTQDNLLQYCLWIYNTFFAQPQEGARDREYINFWHVFDIQAARLGPCGFGGRWPRYKKK